MNGTEFIEGRSLCCSAVVSFVHAVIRSCYSTKFPQHRARGQSVVQVLNCALRPSSSFAVFISVQLLCKVPRSSQFQSPFRELCSTAKVIVSTTNFPLFIPCYYVSALLCPVVQVSYTTWCRSLRYTQPRVYGTQSCISCRDLHLVVQPILTQYQYIPITYTHIPTTYMYTHYLHPLPIRTYIHTYRPQC